MFRKLLIANRGEIACRIARSARRMGIATVAVYSDADAHAQHVDLADEAFPLGPAPARDSYLAIDKLLDVARRSGAEAIHPGYGFLSENAGFAESCEAAGLIFVGPPACAMRLMGSKSAAKALMAQAGVPVVPGSETGTQRSELTQAAQRIGYPVLIKAAGGGGGRGMRIVAEPEKLAAALNSAQREAMASFGDETLLIEKYLSRCRHVEIQIFADAHGGVVSFFERDCSMQRRHQKIVEETPAPSLPESVRAKLSEAAIRAARAADYIGAGTVEFLVKNESFYFLEMNTRLQVEHPITEMVSGQDFVEWQLRIACREKLPLAQEQIAMRGAAIEARICAEDPSRGFLPSVGEISWLRLPSEAPFLRIDTGVRQGDRITQYYDSLIAKLIVWGENRAAAARRLQAALDEVEIVGVATNLDLLRALARSENFLRGEYDTEFVERSITVLTRAHAPSAEEDRILLAAATAQFLADAKAAAQKAGEECSPWTLADGWRLNGEAHYDIAFLERARTLSAKIHPAASQEGFRLEIGDATVLVEASSRGDRLSLRLDGVKHEVGAVCVEGGVIVILKGRNYFLQRMESAAASRRETAVERRLIAPIPARVTHVLARVGERVAKGTPLIVLEAMKMEITVTAPHDGIVEKVFFAEGDMTSEGAELIELQEVETT